MGKPGIGYGAGSPCLDRGRMELRANASLVDGPDSSRVLSSSFGVECRETLLEDWKTASGLGEGSAAAQVTGHMRDLAEYHGPE